MRRKWPLLTFAFCTLFISSVTATSNSLSPSEPVQITATGDILTTAVVCGKTPGFLIASTNADFNLVSSFSVDGINWSSPVITLAHSPSVTKDALSTILTGEQKNIWYELPVRIYQEEDVNSVVMVSSSSSGFIATWQDSKHNAYSNFTPDYRAGWQGRVPITTSKDVSSDVCISANSSGFMAVWVTALGEGYSSFSGDNGANWEPCKFIATNLQPGMDITVSGSSAGFFVAWIGNDNNAYVSFSSDNGNEWSAPAPLTCDGSVSNSYTDGSSGLISLCAIEGNCVVAWQNNTNDVCASFSTRGPSIVTNDVEITIPPIEAPIPTKEIEITIPAIETLIPAKDVEVDSPVIIFPPLITNDVEITIPLIEAPVPTKELEAAALIITSPIPPIIIEPPTNLIGSRKVNSVGLQYQMYHQLEWGKSPSAGVMGYYVYHGDSKIQTLDASTFESQIYLQKKKSGTLYSVTAFDAVGNESSSVSFDIR